MGSLAELALALAVARRAVEQRRAEEPRSDDFEITLCSPCGGHPDDDRRGPRDFSRGYTLCLQVVDS